MFGFFICFMDSYGNNLWAIEIAATITKSARNAISCVCNALFALPTP
jgi:hypothetical protein